ncbi:TetR/AcrR family transcriptional regulator [Actinoallomurus iriomotensis]|uniref:TetR family transcriptional regulator n=1 Tax=Actinoallomurus iriomotensis TaxID=478107 RepID=A0A9W6SBR4_9ACTN|nr:TetR/AcrR family transcriptional regulator [Actinoallomurus iriomotensis]GLY89322.1 TetR family transcriptional regulator [Actinoallomurus iriomotensis]
MTQTRPGGRTARTRAAVLTATVDELIEAGYAGLSMESVAHRAGVHKATVYRRWGTLEGLLVDALTFFADQSVPTPDTGDIDGDLRELARSALAVLADRTGQALVRAMVSAGHHSQVAQVIRAFWADHTTMVAEIVARAVRRGELPPGTRPADVSRAIGAPLYMRLLVTAEPLDGAAADQAAAAVAAAARAGVFASS